MLTFIDHVGKEKGALSTFKLTNAVNGERFISGTIHGSLAVERGWGIRHEDEYYKIIYAKPKNIGDVVEVEFDAVHQFFWDFDKSSVYTELSDGSHPFEVYLEHIFANSGYRYSLEVDAGNLRKQNFGLKKRLALFNDLIKHAGVEFQVRGKVVRILERTGTDLSTVVRKKLNLNDLTIEKHIGSFITYQRGLGAWYDETDHSKGRLEVEYNSPLATIYGRLEGEPYVDERFTNADNFREVLKKSVEDSYSISVQLTMEDLQKAGYKYTRPIAGDYITVIDEGVDFKERVRIVSFETEYDVKGQIVDHRVTCNDIGSVKKQNAGYSLLKSSVADVAKDTASALETANKALISADGKSTVYFGTEFPQDIPKGTLTKGDTLYLKVGDKIKMYYWNGAEWVEPPVVNDVEAFKQEVAEQFAESDRLYQENKQAQDQQIAEVLAKADANAILANEAKTLSSTASEEASKAISSALRSKEEAIQEASRLVGESNEYFNTQLGAVNQEISILNGEVSSKVSKTEFDSLSGVVNNHGTTLTQQANQILLKADKTYVDTIKQTVDRTSAELAIANDAISQRVTKTVFDQATQRLDNAETSIQTIAGQIEQRLTRTQLEEALGNKDYVVSSTMSNLIEESTRGTRQLITQVESKIPTKIGARNLLRNGDFSQGIDYWESNSGNPDVTINATTDLKNKVGRKGALWLSSNRATPNGQGVFQRIGGVQLTAGDKLTFSFDIAGHNNNASLLIIANGENFDARTTISPYQIPNIASDFAKTSLRRLQVTLDVRVDVTAFNFIVVFADGTFGNVVMSNLMLETGPVASDFSYHESELVTSTQFHEITDRVDSHARTIGEQGNAISQIVQTANGIISRVDKISVGGTNLLRNTKDYSGDWSYNGNRRTLAPWQYKGLSALAVNHAWDGLSQLVEVKAGEVYTFSAYVASSSGNDTAHVFIVLHGNRSEPKATIDIPQKSYRIDSNFKQVSHTFQVLQDGYIAPRFERSDTSSTLYVAGLKLERGSIPTDYSPAPEDNDTAIQSVSTRVNQLAGSWAVQNLTSAGTILNQFNLLADGTNRIDGRLTHITGQTLIEDGVIKSAMIGNGQIGTAQIGTIDAAVANIINLNVNKLVGLDVNFIKAKIETAMIEWMRGKTISATNDAMKINLNAGQILYYTDKAALKRILDGYPTQFVKFATGTVTGKGRAGVTVIGSNRDGSENPNNGSFAGIRIWNGIQSDGSFFDKMDIGADDVQIGHKVFDDGNGTYRGWQFKSYGEGSAVSLFPYGNYGRATITATNYRIFNLANNTYVNLEEVLNKIFDNFNNLNNNGNYQRSFYSSWR